MGAASLVFEANEDKLHLRVLSSRCPEIYRGDKGRRRAVVRGVGKREKRRKRRGGN